ncbi:autotransporter outer membrane beta-barrel domain-containing protein [Enterobacter mori]|uniref:autotransporter outer membrane beta-barrel domain-containing protein n=1 Tax=Enterobacter mori TaxID=539813 RepID=UPI002ED09D1C|nr:autotransporter outer membrane beta-barrel domain-containing protein [Enterobacter mori]
MNKLIPQSAVYIESYISDITFNNTTISSSTDFPAINLGDTTPDGYNDGRQNTQLTLNDSHISGAGGIYVFGDDDTVILNHSTVTGTGMDGVPGYGISAAGEMATIDVINGSVVTGSPSGTGVTLSGQSGTVNASGAGTVVSGGTGIAVSGDEAAVHVSDEATVSGDTAVLLDTGTTGASLDVQNAAISGTSLALDIRSEDAAQLSFIGSSVTGDILNESAAEQTISMDSTTWRGGTGSSEGAGNLNIALNNGSVWTATGDSVTGSIAMSDGSTLIMDGGNITTATLQGNTASALSASPAAPVTILSTWNSTTSSAYMLTADTATGSFQGGVTSGSSGAAGDMTGDTIIHVDDASGATFTSTQTDAGVYRYTSEAVTNADGSVDVVLNPYTPPDDDTLSTAGQSVVNTRAAALNLWYDEEAALNRRMDNERRSDNSGVSPGNRGVWGSYYGGNHRQQMNEASTSFDQDVNGFMVGADTRIDTSSGNWLVGFAAMRGYSGVNMHDIGSAGADIDSYGLSLYASYRLNSGLFFDASVKGEHLDNSMDVVSTDGGRSRADYSNSGYGGSLKTGYYWQATDALWVEPYAKMSYVRYDGVNYTLDNGLHAKDDKYTSLRVEGGADLGMTVAMNSGAEVRPYLHLAVMAETRNDNTMDINGVTVNDSTDGARGVVGLGADMKFTPHLSAWAGANYGNGHNTEDPWQLNAGVSWTW